MISFAFFVNLLFLGQVMKQYKYAGLCSRLSFSAGLHHNASLRVGQEESLHQDELLRSAHLQRSLPAVGLVRLLPAAGQLRVRGPAGDGGGSLLLLHGGHLPQPTGRLENIKNSAISENFV